MTSSAAKTTFCGAKIEGPDKHFLWIDGNQKITADNGTYEEPEPNAFSLVQIQDCPFATPTCKLSCYVHGLQKHAKSTHDLYVHNSRTIKKILHKKDRVPWVHTMAEWITENCQGGFRWHVSGDLYSARYGCFIRNVCRESPTVDHWIYTRSFEYTKYLMFVNNLQVMLSCDADNLSEAMKCYDRSERIKPGSFRLAYLATDGTLPDLPAGSIIFPDYSLRGRDLEKPTEHEWWKGLDYRQKKMVCPVDFLGKSKTNRCGVCRKCLP